MARDDIDLDDTEDATPSRRFRVIPLTMIMLALMLVVQVNEIYNDSLKLRSIYGVGEAEAEEGKAGDPKDNKIESAAQKQQDASTTTTKPDEAAMGAAVAADNAAKEQKDAASDKKDDAKPADAKPTEAKADDGKPADGGDKKTDAAPIDPKTGKPAEEPKTFGTGKSTVKQIDALKAKTESPRFSQNEIDLLENLSKRREELDAREKDLMIKAKVLDAAEKRIDDKMAEMKALDAQLGKTVALYNEKQNMQIASLVKIYSAMKPIQAATIFNELDMPILLEVVDKMPERKVAPVLALMDPKKAKDVTEELAAMRKSNSKAATAANGAAKPPAAP